MKFIIVLVALVHIISFVGIATLVKRHKPHHFHSQSAFSVLLGIYVLFFALTAMQSAVQIASASS